ncbi:ABC transporter permease/M1 family aminopeptidase [Parvularcula dongshanensis]|uniref:ABC-type transport system involved in multi-copper enzyme maturation permease subunit n=1 Tax=Parvularcula dongshanensis TaxID=1173995 RepID=A0A840HY97_9PROT|nr:M1 family aminopeptidase [Parvularcula dongshanensis]MBB4657826.1 ABC-type transport system involved in multi-copper enzyme maturation permease subunit [Parvularcula dongshanensis]
MLGSVIRFELSYQLKSAAFVLIFALFFLFVFGAVTIDQIQIGSSEAVHINSPAAAQQIIAVMGVIGMFIPVVFLATGVTRDRTLGTEETFRSTPVGDRTLLLGRYVGGLIVSWLCFASVPLAFLAGSLMPWLDQEQMGPFNPGQVFYLYLLLGVINIAVAGTVLYTIANLTRSLLAAWIAMIALLIGWVVAVSLIGELETRDTAALFEPFGIGAASEQTRYWTAAERNAQVPALSGLLLQNRLLYGGVALVLLAIDLALPRGLRVPGALRRKKKLETGPAPAALRPVDLPRTTPAPLGAASFLQLGRRTRFEVGGVVRSVAFWVVLLLSIVNTVGSLWDTGNMYGTQSYPVTRLMVTDILGAFSFIPLAIAVYYTAELVWRERSHRFHEIVDATPTPSWVLVSAKFLAVFVILVALAVVAALTAMLIQTFRGYAAYDVGQYALRLGIDFVIAFGLLTVLALFFQVLTNNRWAGIGVILAFFVVSIVLDQIGFENVLYTYGSTSGWIPWSDMNGGAQFVGISLWLTLYWSLFAVALAVLTFVLWSRGSLEPIGGRLRRLPSRYGTTSAIVTGVALIGFGVVGTWIWYNTSVRNDYLTAEDMRDGAEAYERRWREYEFAPQPTITSVDLDMALYPHKRAYVADVVYTIENREDEPLTTAHVDYGWRTTVLEQSIEGAHIEEAAPEDVHYVFAFDTPMQPGETRTLRAKVESTNPGFKNRGNQSSVNWNGTFVTNDEALPQMGWGGGKILTDRAERRKRGLPEDPRMPAIDDERYWDRSILGADWIDFRAEITTDADQIAVAPGYLVSDTTTGDRRTFTYEQDVPIQNFFAVQSADYEVKEDLWDAPEGQDDVTLQVFYDEHHPYNVDRMIEAMKLSLARFSAAFSPFQYRQMRIQEFPAYQTFAQSFPNTVPYSEAIGFIQKPDEDDDIDAVTYVTAHEVAHQWFGHQLSAAPVQGSTMLIESFAQYGALLVMEDLYGPEQMRRFLRYELDGYLSGRAGEPIEEMPLALVENQQYIHYQKGGLVMYLLRDVVGEEAVNRSLARMIDQWAYKSRPYPRSTDYLAILRDEVGPEHQDLVTDLFERIVLWDVDTEEVRATERADGRWDVTLKVAARKLVADGAGNETEEDFTFPMDVGVFTKHPREAKRGEDYVLFFEKREVRTGTQEITVTVDERPAYAGADPYNKLIDRTPEDNVTAVTVEETAGAD